jgi:hypothetical protein
LLGEVERLSESIVRLEGAVSNLQQREASITQSANPPRFILKHYRKEFMAQVGVEVMPIGAEDPLAGEHRWPTRTDDCEASRLHQGT